jgi:hypothetical protein
MNAEVEIHVGERQDVLAVPNAALRTRRDVASAAQGLGLDPDEVQRGLAESQASLGAAAAGRRDSASDSAAAPTARQRPASRARAGGRTGGAFGGRYIVFVKRPGGPAPVWVQTGLTDLDMSEVVSGLEATDSVLILPSQSLVQSQTESRERINRITGGGAVPGMQQQGAPGTQRAPAAGTR